MHNIVVAVAKNGLCSGCGVCAGMCPREALVIMPNSDGDPVPHLVGSCSIECGLCLRVCPFSKGVHDSRDQNEKLFARKYLPTALYNDHAGWHLQSMVGYVNSDVQRAASASGGLLTWCLGTLMGGGMVDRVCIVRQKTGSREFEFFAASSTEEIRLSSGSVYQPVDMSALVRLMSGDPSIRWAAVGVPCLCTALRRCKSLKGNLLYVFGMACGMYQNPMYTEVLLRASGVHSRRVGKITYRTKTSGPSAVDYCFSAEDVNGKVRKLIPYMGLPFFLGSNAYFRLNACNFCKDVFAESADACFMDAWLPRYSCDSKGTSFVLIRDPRIAAIFDGGRHNQEIQIEDIATNELILSQQGHIRRKRELVGMRVGIIDGKTARLPSLMDRFDWWAQCRTQVKSKRHWSTYGRRYGLLVFWLSLIDILIVQMVLRHVMPRVLSVFNRMRKSMTV